MTLQLVVVGVIWTLPTTCVCERLEHGTGCSQEPSFAGSVVPEVARFSSRQLEGLRPCGKGSLVNVVETAAPLSAGAVV